MADRIATPASYTSAVGTVYFGLTLNEIGVVVGIVATVVTLGVNWWFKLQHLRLARERAGAVVDEG